MEGIMRERGIIFSGPMVRAILEGRKTQTRRIVKRIPCECGEWIPEEAPNTLEPEGWMTAGHSGRWTCECCTFDPVKCPYGIPGDRLYVRECFSYCERDPRGIVNQPVWYWADGAVPAGDWTKPKPSIHMPKKYARIWLEILSVRVERVQEISEADAIAEGWEKPQPTPPGKTLVDDRMHSPLIWFRDLWNEINGKRPGCSWKDNPWVWVVEFKRLAREEGRKANG
jgi:hypothetical protein